MVQHEQRRTLRFLGVEPELCRNVTDVDDVLDAAARRAGAAYDEFAAIQTDTAEWYLCRGKLVALNQVIGFFSSIDAKAFGARAGR